MLMFWNGRRRGRLLIPLSEWSPGRSPFIFLVFSLLEEMFPFFSRPVLKSLSFTTGRGFANQAAFRAQNGKDHLARKLSDLNDHLKNTGRVPTRDFLSGLKEMTQPGTEVTPIQGLLMLRCCGSLLQEETREKRNELAEQTWSALIDRNVQLDYIPLQRSVENLSGK